jgi:hypothetical protein
MNSGAQIFSARSSYSASQPAPRHARFGIFATLSRLIGVIMIWSKRWRRDMKMIGLIGGMSFESSAVYYRQVNEAVRGRLGGLVLVEVLMYFVNFEDIVAL